VGNYIEFGQYRSARSRAGTKWSKILGHKRKETKKNSKMPSTSVHTSINQLLAQQVTKEILSKLKTSIEDAIDQASRYMPTECQNKQMQ
jgi:hypothetical protein